MKQTIKFFTLLLVSTMLFSSCGGDDTTENTETSITIISNRQTVLIENQESFIFTVNNNLSQEVTTESTIYVNDSPITGNEFLASEIGVYQVYAKKGDFQSNTITVEVISAFQSLILSADTNRILIGSSITFSLTDNIDRNLSTESGTTYLVNGSAISSNVFTPNTNGSFSVQATYDGVTSNTIIVNALSEDFSVKPLIEDYTGAWCGWCPRIAYSIELVEDETNNAIPVAIHNGDTMTYQFESQLRNYFGVTGFPTGKINRTTDWAYPENSNIAQVTDLASDRSDIGLSISSTRTGNNLSIDVSAKFSLTHTENLKLFVCLVEDGLHETQTNYTSFYGGVDHIANMEHNHVLRKIYTNLLGDAIPSSDTEMDDTYTTSFNVTIPAVCQATASDKLQIVAFIVNGDTKAAINAQKAYVETTQDFD